jgi:hypothetical protein
METVLKEWRVRCDYYRARIDAVVAPNQQASATAPKPR